MSTAVPLMWTSRTHRYFPTRSREHVVAVLRRHDEIARGRRVMCLALPRADRNLLDAIQKERFAGINKVQVMAIVRDIALALKELHDHHLVHGDVKV